MTNTTKGGIMFNKVVDKVIVVLGLIGLIFLWGMCINAFAMDLSDVNKYIHKKVLITYKEDGHLKADCGRVFRLLNDDQDHTYDKIYSYIVFYSYRQTLETIKIKDIKSMEELE